MACKRIAYIIDNNSDNPPESFLSMVVLSKRDKNMPHATEDYQVPYRLFIVITDLRINYYQQAARLERNQHRQPTDQQTQRLILARSLSSTEKVLHLLALLDVLSARVFPRHQRTHLAREVPLRKDVIRDVPKALQLDVR